MFHPFYVKNEDGTGQWKAASNLEAGDELLTEDGKKVFVSEVRVEKLEEEITVYNLELDEVHTYYVALGVLVHNKCATKKNKKENSGGSAGESGYGNSIQNKKETDLFLPDEFYNKNLPRQVSPGTKYLPKYDEIGNVKQIKMYDDYGREIGWVDYSNHGYGNINLPDYHTVPHWHERIYDVFNRDGKKINHRTDINTPLGDR